jgi:predicted molibdopterin-dependent oxidoreductase YjgC
MNLSGKWQVAEVPDLTDDYLELTPDPHVKLRLRGRSNVQGTYQFGAQSGELDGRLEQLSDGHARLRFTFEGEDELDPVHGYGEATLVDENTLKGYMQYHQGDTYRFVWKRTSRSV